MKTETKIILIKRFKSLCWRVGSYAVIGLLAFISDSIGLLNVPPVIVTLVALVCGEITKYLNPKKMKINVAEDNQ